MRCAITGAAGYVGSLVTRAFLDAGWEVLALGRRPGAKGTTHVPYALGEPPPGSAWEGLDALIHIAYDFDTRSWAQTREVNVAGSVRLLEAAKGQGVRRVVFISSLSAYEGCRSQYGRAKLLIEEAALKLGCEVVRPGLVHGGKAGGMLGALERVAGRSPLVPLIGDGSYPQYLVHGDDLASLVLALCEKDAPQIGRAISAAHPDGVPFRRLLQILAQRHGRKPWLLAIPWRLIHAGLKMLEFLRLPSPFRSDSLIGFVYQNPAPDFRLPELPQITFRPFA